MFSNYSKKNSKYDNSVGSKEENLPIWGISNEKTNDYKVHDSTRPLINFCNKMLNHVRSENYRIFFQGLLADLNDTNFLGEISLHPVPTDQQDGYVIIDDNIIPHKTKFAEIIAPNGNCINCDIVFKDSLGFLVFEKNPLKYFDLYNELDIKKISSLRVRFLHKLENTK